MKEVRSSKGKKGRMRVGKGEAERREDKVKKDKLFKCKLRTKSEVN